MHGLDHDFEWYELDRAEFQLSIASACGTEVLQELCQSRGIALLHY